MALSFKCRTRRSGAASVLCYLHIIAHIFFPVTSRHHHASDLSIHWNMYYYGSSTDTTALIAQTLKQQIQLHFLHSFMTPESSMRSQRRGRGGRGGGEASGTHRVDLWLEDGEAEVQVKDLQEVHDQTRHQTTCKGMISSLSP